MDEATIKSMAAELAKGLKTPEDLNQMTAIFKKFMIETALNTELSEHLGYEKHQPKKGSNARNGFSSKTVLTQDGQLALDIPRDRDGSFEPQIIKKHQTRITSMDDQILSLYAKGMTNREIVALIKSRIKPESEIEIIGYTDRTGDAEYNRSLSARRAEAAFNSINRKDATFKGIGEDILLYDNNTPEGRFYCRTVEITVKTKVK